MKIINAFFIAILFSSITILAQSKNVIADGNPPLTQTMINRLTTLMQWSLNSDLSEDERAQMRSIVISYWKNSDEKSIKSVLSSLEFEQKLATASEDQKRNLQPQIEKQLLEEFQKDPNEPLYKILLAAYKKNHESDNSALEQNSGLIESLVGRWQVSHANSMMMQNVYTGAIGDTNGMISEYDIKPDGRVIFRFYLSQNNYGCTTKVKTSKTGRLSVKGSQVIFDYDKVTTTGSDSCNAKNNYTKNLSKESETFDFNLKSENGKQQFCFANSKLKDCAIKLN